jgi:2-polyprenyl-3-methyl-5-hydroxy-6-metoxy-1,4-benzoquinol methylase
LRCKICSAESASFSRAKILNRHDVEYFRCPACGFVQTEEPHWLAEAYADAISFADVGLVQRNLRRVPIVTALIGTFFQAGGKFIDYGGGYGLLVRLMRDAGFDFYRSDRHCANLLAQGFEANPEENGNYELLTAMELFEHLADPIGEIERMLGHSRSIFFTTLLLPDQAPQPGDWWYYVPDQGQHISFYTRKSLAVIAERFGLTLVTDGVSRHLLTERRVSPLIFSTVTKYKTALILAPLFRRKSLVPSDYQKVTGRRFAGSDT